MSEQPTPATKQPPQDPKENTPPLQPSPPSSDGPVVAKREVAQKTLEALRSAIQSISRSGIDTARIKTQLQGLQDQLTESTDDSDIDELTAKAAGLLAEITKHRPKPPSRSNTFVIKDPKPEASPEPASAGGKHIPSSVKFCFRLFDCRGDSRSNPLPVTGASGDHQGIEKRRTDMIDFLNTVSQGGYMPVQKLTTKKATSRSPQVVTLIIDDSGSMSAATAEGPKNEQATSATKQLVMTMQSWNQGSSGSRYILNIAKFGSSTIPIAEAAKPEAVSLNNLVFAADSGGTEMPEALNWASQALQKALAECKKIPGYAEEASPNPLVLFFSDGENTGGRCWTGRQNA